MIPVVSNNDKKTSVLLTFLTNAKSNAPINVNPVGGGGVRARGGDLMSETIPLSGF